MSGRLVRSLGVGGVRAVAAALVVLFAAAVALGDRVGAPTWLLVMLGGLAVFAAVAVVVLAWAEYSEPRRALARRARLWVETHFGPRGRGVARKGEAGQYFTGRANALRELVAWLSDERGGVCVVTGAPGSGKSAVLGRLIALADGKQRRMLAKSLPQEMVPAQDSVDVVVWAKGLTTRDVVETIASSVGISASSPDELIDEVVARGAPLVVLLDALDEASGEGEGRRIAQRLLRPLAVHGKSFGVRVLVGTRRGPRDELVDALGADKRLIDLDDPAYLDVGDLAEYVRRRLLRESEPASPTPYRGAGLVTARIAAAVAARANPSFLVAQLVSRSLVEASEVVDVGQHGWAEQFPTTVGDAMADYLDCFDSEPERRSARFLLTALAYAEGAGLPHDDANDLWPRIASAIAGVTYDHGDVSRLLQTGAVDLIERTITNGTPTYRLFHQALADHLRASGDPEPEVQRRIAEALEASVPESARDGGKEWSRASAYVRLHLATHAGAAGRLDHLVEDPGYVIASDPTRLLRTLPAATAGTGRAARQAFQQVVHLLHSAPASERAAYLEMAARQCGADALAADVARRYPDRPWSVPWASWRTAAVHYIGGRHKDWVTAVACGNVEGRPVLVSGGADATVRVWDLAAGTALFEPLIGHRGPVTALAVAESHRGPVAVSAGADATVRVWDLLSGTPVGDPWVGHRGPVTAVAVESGIASVVVSVGADGMLRAWDLVSGDPLGDPWTGHRGRITSVAVGHSDARGVVVSGGADCTLRIWNLADGAALGDPLSGHRAWVSAVALAQLGGRSTIVSGCDDGTVRTWDLASRTPLGDPIPAHPRWVTALATTHLQEQPVIVSGGRDGTVRVWDLATGTQLGDPLTAHTGTVDAVAVGMVELRPVIVSGGRDGTVRVWEPATEARYSSSVATRTGRVTAVAVAELEHERVIVSGEADGTLRMWDAATGDARGDAVPAHRGTVEALAVGEFERAPVLVSGGADGYLRIWDPLTGDERSESISGHTGAVNAVALGEHHGRTFIVSGGADGAVRLWDLATGAARSDPMMDHFGAVNAVVVTQVDGEPVVVSAGHDRTVRIWKLSRTTPRGNALRAHGGWVVALAVGEIDHEPVIISGGHDRTVRLWNVAKQAPRGLAFRGHDGPVTAVAFGETVGQAVIISGGADGVVRVWGGAGRTQYPISVGSVVWTLAPVSGGYAAIGADGGLLLASLPTPRPQVLQPPTSRPRGGGTVPRASSEGPGGQSTRSAQRAD